MNKWLPIVTRLEEQFKSHEKAKGIDCKTYAEQVFTELDQLKAENEVLKKVNKTNQEKIKKLNEQLEEEFIAQQYGDMALFCKVEDYKQTLTEIKEIAEKAAEESGVFKEYFKRNNYSWKQHQLRALTCKYNIILQKCEVLDVN